jgi:hypothetical protein
MFGVEGKCIQVLEGKSRGKRPLGIPRPSLEYNTEVGLKRNKMGWCILGLCGSREGQLAGCCEHGSEHLGSIKCGDFFDCVRN